MTIKATGDDKLDGRLRALRAALRGLDGTDGRPRARRTARKRVLAAMRAVRADVDERWPAIVSREGVRRLKTFEGRLRRLTSKGWEVVDDATVIAAFAAAGVPIRRVEGTAAATVRAAQWGLASAAPPVKSATLVPGWAIDIGPRDTVRLRAAKRSNAEKRIARAEAMLRT
jgi:hypothetical protein